MKFRVSANLSHNLDYIIRQAGYFSIFDKHSKKSSYIRPLSDQRYPRFHLYAQEEEGQVVFDLHLDQSSTRYDKQRAHRADYDSEEVRNELVRIYGVVEKFLLEKTKK